LEYYGRDFQPMFWPLISIPLGLIGLVVGLWIHAEFGSRRE